MKSDIKCTCLVDSVYTLLVYLLFCNEDQIKRTFFFFGNGIDKSIINRFHRFYHVDKNKKWNNNRFFLFVTFRLCSIFRWPFLRRTPIVGHDHLSYSPYLIGNRKYTYIEDAPFVFSIYTGGKAYKETCKYWSKPHTIKGKLKLLYNKIVGDTYLRPVANNDLCEGVVVTELDPVSYLKDKIITQINLKKLWQQSSCEKKRMILNYFDISDEDLDVLKGKKNILFTQQFSTDKFITEEDQIKIYGDIIKNYENGSLLIKPHPRDLVDYNKYFPNVAVFKKVVPVQIFDLLDVIFENAITICSSSVLSFSYDINIDWVGTKVHPVLFEKCGDRKLEQFIKL